MARETEAATPVPGLDTLAALYPYDIAAGARTGAHPGKRFTIDGKADYIQGVFFQGEDISFSTVPEMHAALVSIAEAGQAFLVRGQRAHSSAYLRRCKMRKGSTPRGLKPAKLHAFPIDCDKWPNVDGLDPRLEPVGAWSWMLGVLGAEFEVDVSAHWSSSCCVRTPAGTAPETLDARFWVRLDKPVSEQGCRALLKVLDARVKAFYRTRGVEMDKRRHPVDPKLADIQQPIYLATPVFDGIPDPLPSMRREFLEGNFREVSTASLWSEVPPDPAPGPAAEIVATLEKAVKAPRTRKGKMRVPGTVLPLAASGRLIAAQRNMLAAALAGTGSQEYREACTNLFHRRMALELVALCGHRGGVPEGERDEAATRIASALVASLPLGWSRERVRGEIRQLLVLVCGTEWTTVEWEQAGADASIIDRYLAASRGERTKQGRDLRYTYSKSRLLEEFSPTADEVLELGLRSLASDRDRSAAEYAEERQADGGLTRDAWLAEARQHAPVVHRLHAEGLSARKIVAATGLPISKVLRLLKLDADTVADLAAMAVQPGQDDMTLEQPAEAADDIAAIEGSIRYLQSSQGLIEAWDIAAALGEPPEWIEDVMVGMLAMADPMTLEPLRLAA